MSTLDHREAVALRRSLGGWCLLMVVAMALTGGAAAGQIMDSPGPTAPAASTKFPAPVVRVEARRVRVQHERPAAVERTSAADGSLRGARPAGVSTAQHAGGSVHGLGAWVLSLPPPSAG